MILTAKEGLRLIGIVLICCCAAYVCALFLNYGADLRGIEKEITPGLMRTMYEAQLAMSSLVTALAGGALLSTSAVILCFYITRYIDGHRRELGVLKALGWSRFEIGSSFWVFGLSVLVGMAAGVFIACAQMGTFYAAMNEDGIYPDVPVTLHGGILAAIILLPAAAFCVLAVGYATRRLRTPALDLIRGTLPARRHRQGNRKNADGPFLAAVRRSVRSMSPSLLFFTFIGAFCFSTMLQMSASMTELASEWMAGVMLMIGIVLGTTCLFLSISSAVDRYMPAAAIMHAHGYTEAECRSALLGCFRPLAWLGFAAGTVYQYVLLRIVIDAYFSDLPMMPEYEFNMPVMFAALAAFAIFYELGGWLCARQLSSVKPGMLSAE